MPDNFFALHQLFAGLDGLWAKWLFALVLIVVLGASAAVAWRIYVWASDLQLGQFDKVFRGPIPSRIETVKRQLREAESFANWALFKAAGALLLLILTGFLIPTYLLGAYVASHGWLFADGCVLSVQEIAGCAEQYQIHIANFGLDQLLKGAAFDFFDFFECEIGSAEIVSKTQRASVFMPILLFRFYTGSFTVVILYIVYLMCAASFQKSQREIELLAVLASYTSDEDDDD